MVGSRVAWLAGLHNVLGEVPLEEVTFAFQPQFLKDCLVRSRRKHPKQKETKDQDLKDERPRFPGPLLIRS